MRVFMPDLDNSPVTVPTATASESVKTATLHSLKLRQGYHLENLGNFWRNLRYEAFSRSGGQKAYDDVCQLLSPPDTPLSDTDQIVIFVDDYIMAHSIALAVQKYFGLSGKSAYDLIPVYHSLHSNLVK